MMNWRMNTSSALLTEAPRWFRAGSLQTVPAPTSLFVLAPAPGRRSGEGLP